MPKIEKPKNKTAQKAGKTKKPTQPKNPVAYFQCMKTCCQKGQSITKVASECKTNSLAISAKISAEKAKAVKKVAEAYKEMGQGLSEFIKAAS